MLTAAAAQPAGTGFTPFEPNRKFSGLGVVEKIYSTNPLEFRADGFRVRLSSDSQTSFHAPLKAADLTAGVFARFSGRFDSAGVLQARQADFSIAKPPSAPHRDLQPAAAADATNERSNVPPSANIVNLDGTLGDLQGKFSFKDDSGWYRLTDDASMQERVRRVGAMVTPEYQKHLPQKDLMKLRFRFYVVEQGWMRSPLYGLDGVTLIPRPIVQRLKQDDQLAAVLADGVAYQLQMQKANLGEKGLEGAAQVAGVLAMAMMETSVIAAGGVAKGIVGHEQRIALERERGRVSLGLLADAGFDPWQAPEAWRLLQPNKIPKDLDKLKYPDRSQYQFRFLMVEYPRADGTARRAGD